MPITQNRMLDLISAADDYANALGLLCRIIRAEVKQIEAGTKTKAQAFEEIAIFQYPDNLLVSASTSAATIASERQHFKLMSKRNTREAARQKRKREEQELNIRSYETPHAKLVRETMDRINRPAPIRLDADPNNPEDVEGGFLDKPRELTKEEEETARRIARETLRKYNQHE